MRQRRYLQLDVFASEPGRGNPLAVVLDAADLDTASVQSIAAWLNLSETTFVLPSTQAGADYRLRILTPRQELPFAGHPSVGTVHAVLERGLIKPSEGQLVQECGAGLLQIRVDEEGGQRRLHVYLVESNEMDPSPHLRHRVPDWRCEATSLPSARRGSVGARGLVQAPEALPVDRGA